VIFVSVGHQMPFDRMLRWVASWAEQRERVAAAILGFAAAGAFPAGAGG